MDLIALSCNLAGLALLVVTLVLSLSRYHTLRRLPRRPSTWLTLADWVLFSGPGLSLGMSMVAFGGVVGRWAG